MSWLSLSLVGHDAPVIATAVKVLQALHDAPLDLQGCSLRHRLVCLTLAARGLIFARILWRLLLLSPSLLVLLQAWMQFMNC